MGTVHALTVAARHNTSLREGGGLGRSPKTEGASGCIASLTGKDGTSQSHPISCAHWRQLPGKIGIGYR